MVFNYIRSICIHGHFYQPPRENPWLEEVEKQDSAHPFHDWNEKITYECYQPNAEARLLDERGRLRGIINNYEFISFNFGPTLLSWLERSEKNTYKSIIEADAISKSNRAGHGNALAQVYNHMIMPLANTRDRITQIIWGLKDFKHRFQREAEGMWLPETAVDLETLEILVDQGVLFTILSPKQASRLRNNSAARWQTVDGVSLDPSRPYQCLLPSGSNITIFFYDGPVSQAIAFEGLLNDGSVFKDRLLGAFSTDRSWPQLVNIATDGESYGHHHRFGEMALAFAIEQLLYEPNVRLTNYGEFLANNPPTAEVEIIERTSWSCSHGVGRWIRDCGCSTSQRPGWKQSWRTPLRRSLDIVREQVDELFEIQGSELFLEPFRARNDYIDLILRNRTEISSFLKTCQKHELSPSESVEALSLLEMQRNRMLMYTSCGWFFDDLTGIETLQILDYAARVLQLASFYDPGLVKEFLGELFKAVSNVQPHMNGDQLYREKIAPHVIDLAQVAAHVAISALFDKPRATQEIYVYKVHTMDLMREEFGERILLIGQTRVQSSVTLKEQRLVFAVLYLGAVDLRCSVQTLLENQQGYEDLKKDFADSFKRHSSTELIRKLDKYFPHKYFAFTDLFVEQRTRLLEIITKKMFQDQAALLTTFYKKNEDFARLIVDHDARLPDTFRAAARFVLNRQFLKEIEKLSQEMFPESLESILRDTHFWKIQLDLSAAQKMISHRIGLLVEKLGQDWSNQSTLSEIFRFLDMAQNLEIYLQLSQAQTTLFKILREAENTSDFQIPPGIMQLANRLAVRLNGFDI
jgi:alpha-amylase/alpha-mannosidase (GH57 family)